MSFIHCRPLGQPLQCRIYKREYMPKRAYKPSSVNVTKNIVGKKGKRKSRTRPREIRTRPKLPLPRHSQQQLLVEKRSARNARYVVTKIIKPQIEDSKTSRNARIAKSSTILQMNAGN